MTLLQVSQLRAGFGGNLVLQDLSFEVERGRTLAVLGFNGAGKSVAARCISGTLRPWSGELSFLGENVTMLSVEKRVARGMAHVPQGGALFSSLTVERNLLAGGYTLGRTELRDRLEAVYTSFPRVRALRRRTAGTLSGGERSSVAVARAMMSRPQLLVADEPTAGLSPASRAEFAADLKAMNDSGTGVLLIEQNLGFALDVAHDVLVLQAGVASFIGPRSEISDEGELMRHLGIPPT